MRKRLLYFKVNTVGHDNKDHFKHIQYLQLDKSMPWERWTFSVNNPLLNSLQQILIKKITRI